MSRQFRVVESLPSVDSSYDVLIVIVGTKLHCVVDFRCVAF